MNNQIKTIHYGIGKEYLKNWGINEALREIYQNFFDFGEYWTKVKKLNNGKVLVRVSNNYNPEQLEFLRIGNSIKHNDESIGKHGEGLKMALLIFLKENLNITIYTYNYIIFPKWEINEEVGELFSIKYSNYIRKYNKNKNTFCIQFEINEEIYNSFINNIVTKEDIIFKHNYHGEIVNKTKGNLYSGNLYVCNIKSLSASYNIPPSLLNLDRDRSVPRSFEVNFHCSKIKEAEEKLSLKDLEYSDTEYINNVSQEFRRQWKPILVGNDIQFTAKDPETKKTIVLTNNSIKENFKQDSFFETIIKKLKQSIVKHLGLYDLLLEFQAKHVHSTEAKQDFEIILSKVKK